MCQALALTHSPSLVLDLHVMPGGDGKAISGAHALSLTCVRCFGIGEATFPTSSACLGSV